MPRSLSLRCNRNCFFFFLSPQLSICISVMVFAVPEVRDFYFLLNSFFQQLYKQILVIKMFLFLMILFFFNNNTVIYQVANSTVISGIKYSNTIPITSLLHQCFHLPVFYLPPKTGRHTHFYFILFGTTKRQME